MENKIDVDINFRDIAIGKEIAKGRIFRSAALDHALGLFDSINIATVFDLRRPEQFPYDVTLTYRQELRLRGIEWINYPCGDFGDIGTMEREYQFARGGENIFYEWLPRYGSHMLIDILRIIIANEIPLLIHCSAGRDRTGMVVALLLDLVCVDREYIYQDYLLSDGASSRSLDHFFNTIDQFGGSFRFLSERGMKKFELDRLETLLRN